MDKKRVWIHTFGCQMNERDSEIVMGELKQGGLTDDNRYGIIIMESMSA